MPGREHFSGLLDVASDPIWSISLDGLQLLHINEAGSSAFGRPRESMLGSDREWQLLIQEEDRVLLNDRFSKINRSIKNSGFLTSAVRPKYSKGTFDW